MLLKKMFLLKTLEKASFSYFLDFKNVIITKCQPEDFYTSHFIYPLKIKSVYDKGHLVNYYFSIGWRP